MKNTHQNRSKKSLNGSREGVLTDSQRVNGFVRTANGFVRTADGFVRTANGFVRTANGFVRTANGFVRTANGSVRTANGSVKGQFILLPIILITNSDGDFIPSADGDFDEWQKNYVKHLSSPWPPAEEGAPAPAPAASANPLLYIFLGIPEERYDELIDMQKLWNKDFARGGQKADRRSSETIAKIETRVKKYEPLLRSVTNEYIHSNRKASVEIKRALKLTVPDTEKSTEHGSHLTTLAPAVTLKNMGGGKIDVRFSRPEDDNRANVPKGFHAEFRYVLEIALPPDPEDIPTKTSALSSKARFQIEAGMTNKKKTLRSYARWRHKINSAFHSPWTTVMEIDIV